MKKRYILYVLLISITGLICTIVDVAVVDILKSVIDATIDGEFKEVIPKLILTASLVIIVGIITNFTVGLLTDSFGATILRDLRYDTMNHIMKLSPSDVESSNQGDIIEKMSSDIESISSYMKEYFANCILVPLLVIVFGIYLITLHPLLAIVCLTVLAILVPLSVKLLKPIKLSQHEYVKLLGLTNNNIKEAFDGVQVIKSFNMQERLKEKYYKDLKVTLDISNKNDLRQYNVGPISALIREAPTAIALIFGGYMALEGKITLGVLVAFVSCLNKMNGPLEQSYQLVVRTHLASVSLKRINNILKLPVEENKESVIDKNGEYAIQLNNVDFSYGENEVLKNFTLKVKKGEKIALVGRSGCGKSTVINLMCTKYTPVKGEMYLYNNNYKDISNSIIRNELSLISQDAQMFPMSVADNIRLGNKDASIEDVIRVAKQAGCHTFIQEMENGYDTVIAERGANLSGGQKQRISIARAILKNSDILLLDEPTSALDSENEQHIVNTIEEISRNKTVITIAHRLNTIASYDRIINMEEGCI